MQARTWVLGMLVLAAACCACSEAISGNGDRETEKRDVKGFTKVDSQGSVDVAIEYAEDFALTVSLDSNLVPELETHVVGDTLVIEHHPDFTDTLPGPHVRIKMPALRGAELSGSGELTIDNIDSQDAVRLDLSGSGRVSFAGSAPQTTVNLSGSGDVVLRGTSAQVRYDLDGSGDIDARKYECADGDLHLNGSGTIRAKLSDSADVDLSGSGDIYLYGNPDVKSLSLDGSGDVHEE